jgi:hypothetical protein
VSSAKATARQAGVLYVLAGATGWFSIMYVPNTLFVRGDATATARNIMAAELFFRLGILSEVVSQTTFIFLVLSLDTLLKDVDRTHARIMVAFAGLGELSTVVWLIVKGVKVPPPEARPSYVG